MQQQATAQQLTGFWQGLTTPHKRVTGIGLRRRIQLLLFLQTSGLLLTLIGVAFAALLTDLPGVIIVGVGSMGVLLVGYGLARGGWYRPSVYITVLMMSFASWAVIVIDPDHLYAIGLMTVGVALIGLFFSWWQVLGVFLLNLLLMISLPVFGEITVIELIGPIIVQVILSTCVLAIIYYSNITNSDYVSELTEGQAKLRLITSQIPSILWTTDTNLRVNYLVGNRHNGTSGDDPEGHPFSIKMGRTIYEVVQDQNDPQLAAHRFALEGNNAQYEINDYGRIYTVRVEPLREANGLIIGCIALANDITSRKEMEDALRASERRYRSLLEATFEGVIIHDNGMILDVNRAFEVLCGYTREEATGMSLMQIFAPDSIDAALKHIRGRSELPFEALAQRHDGAVFEAEFQAKETIYQNQLARVVALRDITARKQAEAQLRASEILFRQMAENIREIFFVRDVENDRLIYVSPAYDEIWGRPRSRLDAYPEEFWQAIHPQDADEVIGVLRGDSRQPASMEYRIFWPDGTLRWIWSRVFPVQDEKGRVYRIIGISEDITASKQIQMERLEAERLRVELEKERELLELKERFVTMVSHEFRTPLTVIVSSCDLLDRYFDRLARERREEHLRKIKQQSLILTEMMNDVLLFAKAQAGKLTFEPAPVNLRAFCENLYDQFHLSDKHNHALVMTLDCGDGELMLDDKLLQHILVNLLSNAIKYSPPDSPVRFEVHCKAESVVFIVSDRGIGIPEEDLDRLFEPFHRATNTHNVEGTGLGLAIVKNAVDAHRGTILCESAVGIGTTFTVELPLGDHIS